MHGATAVHNAYAVHLYGAPRASGAEAREFNPQLPRLVPGGFFDLALAGFARWLGLGLGFGFGFGPGLGFFL